MSYNDFKNGSMSHKCRGAVAILMAFAILALLGVGGLAIDSGRAYAVKAKLSLALDAASLAAAMAVADGETAATAAATKFFNANYPTGYLGGTASQPNVAFSYSQEGDISIDVSASSINASCRFINAARKSANGTLSSANTVASSCLPSARGASARTTRSVVTALSILRFNSG